MVIYLFLYLQKLQSIWSIDKDHDACWLCSLILMNILELTRFIIKTMPTVDRVLHIWRKSSINGIVFKILRFTIWMLRFASKFSKMIRQWILRFTSWLVQFAATHKSDKIRKLKINLLFSCDLYRKYFFKTFWLAQEQKIWTQKLCPSN